MDMVCLFFKGLALVFLSVLGFCFFALPALAITLILMGVVIGLLKVVVLICERIIKWSR